MSEPERSYGAGDDIPGTPRPFPFDLLAAMGGLTALILGFAAIYAEPMITYGYWIACLDWLVLSVLAIVRGEQGAGIWFGCIAALAPFAISAILGMDVLTRIPG